MSTKTLKKTKLETSYVRSYIAETETVDVLHLDRVDNPWVKDVVRAIEKLVAEMPATASLSISDSCVTMKVTDTWKVEIWRDGTVIIKVPDCVLIADDNFVLMCADKDGMYATVAKAKTVTWDGTEEYFTPSDVRHIVRDTLRRVLERTRWL
jgi:hypothetical protein